MAYDALVAEQKPARLRDGSRRIICVSFSMKTDMQSEYAEWHTRAEKKPAR